MCPVGAVSNTTTSMPAASPSPESMAAKRSKAAISVVHAPERLSSIPATASAVKTPRTGPTTRSR